MYNLIWPEGVRTTTLILFLLSLDHSRTTKLCNVFFIEQALKNFNQLYFIAIVADLYFRNKDLDMKVRNTDPIPAPLHIKGHQTESWLWFILYKLAWAMDGSDCEWADCLVDVNSITLSIW